MPTRQDPAGEAPSSNDARHPGLLRSTRMKTTIKDELDGTLEDLRALCDELRISTHLGEMEAKTSRAKLEQQPQSSPRRA